MGFWSSMLYYSLMLSTNQVPKPLNFPRKSPELPELPDLPDADPIEAVNSAIKGARNAVRRILSIFDDEESRKLRKGDIIGICRGVYDHYGVYADDSSVIHYSSKDSDTSSDNSIIETSLDEFMRGDDTLFKLWFPPIHLPPMKIVTSCYLAASPHAAALCGLRSHPTYELRSPDETVQRARSRLGENAYDLRLNNCEHFAIWCKTGISESHQVNDFLSAMHALMNPTRT